MPLKPAGDAAPAVGREAGVWERKPSAAFRATPSKQLIHLTQIGTRSQPDRLNPDRCHGRGVEIHLPDFAVSSNLCIFCTS